MMPDTANHALQEEEARQRRRARKTIKKRHAAARDAFLERAAGCVDRTALGAALDLLMEGPSTTGSTGPGPAPRSGPAPRDFPANDQNRWVPLGPSVVRQGQAEGRPRVSGRIRDLAVHSDGLRAYGATAKGGVWYTGDGGATWEPLGGWANEPRRRGGTVSAFASGCLLVDFGAGPEQDFVMVGTGEFGASQGPTQAFPMRGMGVLVARGPAREAIQADPWESATGIEQLEGLSIVRMVRVPGTSAGEDGDRVIIATSGGLFMGTRATSGGTPGYTWTALNAPTAPPSPPAAGGWQPSWDPTDLVYAGARLFVCFRHCGVAFSDDNGSSFHWIPLTLSVPAANVADSRLVGRMSLALNGDGNRLYLLAEADTDPAVDNATLIPQLWQISNLNVALPALPTAAALNNVPTNDRLWPGQRDYDQAILATTRATGATRTDRIYLGGSLVWITNWNAAIWAFDVDGANLVPSPGVSDMPAGTTHGADPAGLVGNGVHPDVHALRRADNADGSHQIWVGCDGGVFVSLNNGQTNTFASRNVGLASIESEFVACHPGSSHFAMLGCQDNGRMVRVGESVWEMKTRMQGDGGGVIFHPVHSHYVMGQFSHADWACDPPGRYRPPTIPPNAQDPDGTDPEYRAAQFYSGIDAIRRTAVNRARIALGTTRVWLTDNLGDTTPNTWVVLPITAPGVFANARDPRPGNRFPSNAANMAFGVPPAGFGSVVTVKWVDETTLLALYLNGVIQYRENPASPGQWSSTPLLTPGMAAPAAPLVLPNDSFFTDIVPVPGTRDFYLTGIGHTSPWTEPVPASGTTAAVAAVPPVASRDSCYFYDAAAGGFRTTGLGQALPVPPGLAASPVDPAYAVVVDPARATRVFAGTATGVWQAEREADNTHGAWTPFINGLPQSTVQDLRIWNPPGAGDGQPRLLRAALQSRGVWEVNLAASEPARTYVRVHERDDRRIFPTPLKNPRRRPTASDVAVFRSPDITIRPRSPVLHTPDFRGRNLTNGSRPYPLWTFQTAFRWLYPSIIPNGEWTDQFGDLVERHRRSQGLANAGTRRVDRELWNQVMAAARDENGDPGVFRAPWQNRATPDLPASEIDLMETIRPRRDAHQVWQVYREPSIVDVLLHHRDTRPVAAGEAFAVLMWRSHRQSRTLMSTDCTPIPDYVRSLLTEAPNGDPPGWQVVRATDGTPLHRLPIPLSARMPRAVSIPLDLSGVPTGHRVLLLALAGSSVDPFSGVPAGTVDSVENLVRRWPHAGVRLISVWPRPGTQLFDAGGP